MTHVEVVITQTLHVHGMAMDAAVSHCTESCSQKKVPDFIAIDGEGVGRGRDHKYVLLGVDDSPSRVEIIARYVNDEDSS